MINFKTVYIHRTIPCVYSGKSQMLHSMIKIGYYLHEESCTKLIQGAKPDRVSHLMY